MAKMFYAVYPNAAEVAMGYPVATGNIDITGSSVQSAAIGEAGKSYRVEITPDTNCQFELGTDPTADSDSMYHPANVPIFRFLWGGDKIAVIQKQV